MSQGLILKFPGKAFVHHNRRTLPVGAFVRARLVSGRDIEGQVMKTETTVHGTLLQVEFGDEVANINTRQIIGFYDFSYLKPRGHNKPDPVRKMNNSGRP